MKCPKCNTVLSIYERQGIEIDFCPDCRGVWLERGELDKLIDRANESTTRQKSDYDHSNPYDNPNPRMSDLRRPNEHYAPRDKKKSILGDLFDF